MLPFTGLKDLIDVSLDLFGFTDHILHQFRHSGGIFDAAEQMSAGKGPGPTLGLPRRPEEPELQTDSRKHANVLETHGRECRTFSNWTMR